MVCLSALQSGLFQSSRVLLLQDAGMPALDAVVVVGITWPLEHAWVNGAGVVHAVRAHEGNSARSNLV